MNESTRQKTSKSLRNGKKVNHANLEELKPEPEKPKKRSWESWSYEDKNHFFDGLKQFGRDFGKIKRYMAQKMQKGTQIKNKEQVRHLYYRTWTTISKLINPEMFPEALQEKGQQELYAMLSYGEILRRMKCEPNKKLLETKFEELLKTQQTNIKYKGKSIKVKISLPEGAKSPDQLVSHLDTKVNVLLSPADCYSLRSVQSVGACPHMHVKIPVQTEFSELKQMLAEKWKTKVERIELRLENRDIEPRPSSHGELMPGNSGLNPEKIRIVDSQKFKNGRLTVHYKKMEQGEKDKTEEIKTRLDASTILSILLTTESNNDLQNLRVQYRFIRDRPVCEPVSLLAKCASIFTEVIYDVDKSVKKPEETSDVDEMLRNSIIASQTSGPGTIKRVRKNANRPPSKQRKNSESLNSAKAKESIPINSEAVEMHLKQLNGLNRPGSNRPRNENRASPAYKPETPEHSFQPISESSKAETSLFQEKDLFEPHNDSNSSISNILRSVLNGSDPIFPSSMESEMETHLAHLINENSIDYERLTNFSELLNDTDDDL